MLDTDALLKPIETTKNQLTAWQDVVRANTGAFKEIRLDLGHCNNQEKVQAIINKVEKALEDLNVDSQKIPNWMREQKDVAPGSPPYGQYPVNQPINPDNPVPWAPGYTPPATMSAEAEPAAPAPSPPAKGGKK